MKNKELYEKTINILIDAYHKDTLVHGNCYACAVGNIIAANCGYEFEKDSRTMLSNWHLKWIGFDGYMTATGVRDTGTYYVRNNCIDNDMPDPIIKQIESTGYTKKELRDIEYAFEHVNFNSDNIMFNGLMNVVDVLDKIHENNNFVEIKKKFVKTAVV